MFRKATLGIDLGTYNSAAAVLTAKGEVVAISAGAERRFWGKSRERVKPFPSVVVYFPDGRVRAVGWEAKLLAESEPQLAVWGVKRLLGKTYREALDHGELDRMLLPVEPDGTNGRCMFEFDGREVRPEDVCAELLRHIRAVAEAQLGEDLSEAVISVPAYFDAIATSATMEAARRAGFQQVESIPEPVAAALAYEIQITPRPLHFLVFDLGAGTLDVTAAELWREKPGPTGIQCKCQKNTGDTHLGGLDMDDQLLAHVTAAMSLPKLEDQDRLQLRRAVEAAKIALSEQLSATVEVVLEGERRSYTLTRHELEMVLRSGRRDILAACEEQVRLALKGAGWRPEEVDHLLLIGGPTAMPCVRGVLETVFRRNPEIIGQLRQPSQPVDPMLAVAIGAARSRGTELTKIHPYGYGFVSLRLEPVPGQPMFRVIREPQVLIRRDSVFPSDPATALVDSPFYRLDKIFTLELIQQVPESEQQAPGMGGREFRFLGEYQMAYSHLPFLMQVSMRLTENGELETLIRNLHGPESATYVGVGSLRRHPIELPASKLELLPTGCARWSFLPEQAASVKQWAEGFARFLQARVAASRREDRYLAEGQEELRTALARWGGHLEHDVNQVFTVSKTLLARALELRLLEETEKLRWEEELDRARSRCYQIAEQ